MNTIILTTTFLLYSIALIKTKSVVKAFHSNIKLVVLLLILTLSSCGNDYQTAKILSTGEKAQILRATQYSIGDTIVVQYDGISWELDANWVEFEGNSIMFPNSRTRFYKAVIIK
jgi:hypothetical protein